MSLFPLPFDNPAPVTTTDDVLAVLPFFLKPSDPPPVRDAIIAALVAMFRTYQAKSSYASAQSDILRANGIYLDGLASDREIFRQVSEDDESLRTRILSIPGLVTPAAILAAVNSIIAGFTTAQAQLFEASVDRWFVNNGNSASQWHSFIGQNPFYQDRLYIDDLSLNLGQFRLQSRVGGAWAFGDTIGRYFVLRIPQLPGTENQHMFIGDGSNTNGQESLGTVVSFIADGSNTNSQESAGTDVSFAYSLRQSVVDVYNQIISAVERIKGHSIRWMLFADPNLV